LPRCAIEDAPNYFTNGALDPAKLPEFLKDLKMRREDITITEQEMSACIYIACVLPVGQSDVFTSTNEPGLTNLMEATVTLTDDTPWRAHLRPAPRKTTELEEKIIRRYLIQTLIEASTGPYCSGCIPVEKSSGRDQLAMVYTELNKRSVPNRYPLPLMSDCLLYLQLCVFLSSLDLCGAYFSIPLAKHCRDYFAFISNYGLFRWTRVPYGWRNSGPIFYSLMARVFQGMVYHLVALYADDINPFGGKTVMGHILTIALSLRRLSKAGLRVSVAKTKFFLSKLDYLGHTRVREGMTPCEKNVEKILRIEVKDVKTVRSFIGMALFYRKFIKAFAKRVDCLYKYLTKNARVPRPLPAPDAEAVEFIKKTLSEYPVLRKPDFDKTFYLETDGSSLGLGAILLQEFDKKLHPIEYASTSIKPAQKKYSADKLECLASVWGMIYFKNYLLGRDFVLRTDNIVLKYLRNKTDNLGAMAIWVIESQAYSYTVSHVRGKDNHGPDMLSRTVPAGTAPDSVVEDIDSRKYHAFDKSKPSTRSPLPPLTLSTWRKAQEHDPLVQELVQNSPDKFVKTHGLWRTRESSGATTSLGRVVMPASMKYQLVQIAHSLTGHRGIKPIQKLLRRIFCWPDMHNYVRKFILACADCRRRKMIRDKRRQGIPAKVLITRPLDTLQLDFVMQTLTRTKDGYIYCLSVIDVFTRYPWLIPLRSKDIMEIADALYEHIFSHFGFPRRVHSDNERTLVTEVMNVIFVRFGVRRTTSMAHRPQGNSHIERFHRYLEESLTIILPRYSDWDKMIHVVLFAYRCMVQETTGYSPFFLMFGRELRMPFEFLLDPDDSKPLFDAQRKTDPSPSDCDDGKEQAEIYIARLVDTLQATFRVVRRAQQIAHEKNERRLNQNQLPIAFKRGDLVYWRSRNTPENVEGAMRVEVPSKGEFKPHKLTFRWSGPYMITRATTDVSYGLQHPRLGEIVAHVGDLQHCTPFSDLIVDTSVQSAYAPPHAAPPPGAIGPGPNTFTDPKLLKVNDMCVVWLPEFGNEELTILRFIGDNQFVWYSAFGASRNLVEPSIKKFAKTAWQPGWIDITDDRPIYQSRKPPNGIPYTAKATELGTNFLVMGFELTKSNRVRAELVKWVDDRLRSLKKAKELLLLAAGV